MASSRVAVFFAVVASFAFASCDAVAQLQNNNRNQNAGLSNNGLGTMQTGFGNQAGNRGGGLGLGLQNNQGNQGGVMGLNNANQPRAGSAEAMAQSFENMGGRQQARAQANLDRFIENLNQMRDSQSQARGQRRSYAPVKVRIRPAFKVTPIDPMVLETKLQARMDKSLEVSKSTATMQVTLNNRVATISGTAPDEHERKVLAKILALQPGVSRVDNRLVVTAGESSGSKQIDFRLPTPPPVE